MSLTPALFVSAHADDTDPSLVQVSASSGGWNRVVGLLNSLLNGGDTAGSVLFRDPTNLTSGASWTLTPTLTGATIGTATIGVFAPPLTVGGQPGYYQVTGVPKPSDTTRTTTVWHWNNVGAPADPTILWTQNLTGFANFSSQDNHVSEIGHNIIAGGGLLNPSYSGARDAWESYYEPSTPGVGGPERHIAFIPTDVATHGEIRLMSWSATGNVTRDNMHPHLQLQSEYYAFTHPSTAGVAYGDSFRITIDGTHFGANLSLNNQYSYITRSGVSRGSGYPLIFQQNAAASANFPVLWFGSTFDGSGNALDDDLHLLWASTSGANVIHTGIGGIYTRFVVDGKNSANQHGQIIFRDEQGGGTKESFVAQDGTAIYLGAPQSALANYNDATIAAAAHLTLTSALATFSASVKHGDTVLLHTSVNLANGAGASTGTLTNAPASGNPTKWISIDDNGTTRKIPAW